MKMFKLIFIIFIGVLSIYGCDVREDSDVSNLSDSGLGDIISDNGINEDVPKLCIESESVKFENVKSGSEASSELYIKSCGKKPLEIKDISLKSGSSVRFTISVEQQFATILMPQESILIKVKYYVDSCADSDVVDKGIIRILSNADGVNNNENFIYLEGKPERCSLEEDCILSPEPKELDFGNVLQLQSKSMQLKITNTGKLDCKIKELLKFKSERFTISKIIDQYSNEISEIQNMNLKSKDYFNIIVEMNCDATNLSYQDSLLIKYESKNTEGSLSVPVKGTCVQKDIFCKLDIFPLRLNFGNVVVGKSKTMSIFFENKGSDICIIDNVRFGSSTGNWFSLVDQLTNFNISSGEIKRIDIECAPDKKGIATDSSGNEDPDGENNYLFIKTDSQMSTNCKNEQDMGFCIPLLCRGGDNVLDVLPDPIDFGLVSYGCSSEDLPVTLFNNGTEQINIYEISVSDSSAFAISSSPEMPLVLNSGDSTTIMIRYTPDKENVTQTASLSIKTDAINSNNEYLKVPIIGTATSESDIVDTFDAQYIKGENILWCIDSTSSIEDEKVYFEQNFKKFISSLTNKDSVNNEYINIFNLAVVAEEYQAPFVIDKNNYYPGIFINKSGYPKIITNNPPPYPREQTFEPITENFEEAFLVNSNILKADSDGAESCLEALKLALSDPIINDPAANKGFLNNTFGHLTLIILSDSDDQSQKSVDYYVKFFKSLKNDKMINLFVIAGFDPEGKPADCGDIQNGKGALAANRYKEFASEFKNSYLTSICNINWADTLFERYANNKCNMEYFLSRIPAVDTIEVYVDGVKIARDSENGFVYDPIYNSIYFVGSAIPKNCTGIVTVKYRMTCN